MDEHEHEHAGIGSTNPRPFVRLFDRLREELPDFEFNDHITPFHSSYDNWHIFGKRRQARSRSYASRKRSAASSNVDLPQSGSSRPASRRARSDADTTDGASTDAGTVTDKDGGHGDEQWVVARVSKHSLRLEREFKMAQLLTSTAPVGCNHFVKPIQLSKLPARLPGDLPMVVSIVEAPGANYLSEMVEFGPNNYTGSPASPRTQRVSQVPLLLFLDFAIGASECLEILHHGHETVHGELRGDAFHYNLDTGVVRLVNFGSGVRSFEHGLTSAGWSSLMSQLGVEHKLQFIAPEQTGRLPAEPDSRTDVYSLGILFWTMLTGQPAFEGKMPIEIMQNVLSRRIPQVSSIRSDVPDALSAIVHKMTQKNIDDRYNSMSGIKHDMQQIKKMMTEGDMNGLSGFKVATTDVSCTFNLPSHLIGRVEQRKGIVDVIEKSARKLARAAPVTKKGLYSLSSGSSITSGERPDLALLDDIMSDSTSSDGRDRDSRLNSIPELQHVESRSKTQGSVASSGGSVNDDFPLLSRELHEARNTSSPENSTLSRTSSNYQLLNNEASSLLRTAQKLKRKGRTELVAICGAAGYGKSTLTQSIQLAARKHGYFASAKFDQVRATPFDPVLKVMSSLFRQIFSEPDVNSEFHNNIRTFVKPFWTVLHSYLELPYWLLNQNTRGFMKDHGKDAIGNAITHDTGMAKKACSQAATQDWLRSGGSNKTSRFMHIFLDVLRLLAIQKFICLCLDDLQFADAESLDLVQNIVASHVPIVLMVTYRDENLVPPKIQALFEKATKVNLGPFSDEETGQYISETIHRSMEYCLPIAAVVQEKTGGNPFFIREMLDSCHRSKCVFYCWKCSQWEVNLDKVFDMFSSPDLQHFNSNDFITRRLMELPVDAQTLLAWAAIIGNQFSFSIIKRVMSCDCSKASPKELIPPTSKDPVAGLQVALQKFVVMPTDDEDWFRFSHDRYIQAADLLCENYKRQEMHYVVACAMMKHDPFDPVNRPTKVLFEQARHVCESIGAIKLRAAQKAPYRDLLYQAAESARDSGARAMSLSFFKNALELLPDDPWDESNGDASYGETLALMTKASESYWFLEQYDEGLALLKQIDVHAREAIDKAPAAIIRSRMCAAKGNTMDAFAALKFALADLGLEIPPTSYEKCDEEFQRLVGLLNELDPDCGESAKAKVDRKLLTIGAVLVEIVAASFWFDDLLFYQTTLMIVDIFTKYGCYPQAAVGFIHMGSISVYRFNKTKLAVEFGDAALKVFDAFSEETYTVGRGLCLHALFLGHLKTDMRDQVLTLQKALESSASAGDKILHLLNLGMLAAFRLWASEDLQEIEAYIQNVGEELPEWSHDLRGGAFLVSVRQYVRAMQGKTFAKSAATVMCDERHTSEAYERFVTAKASNSKRTLTIYHSYQLIALFNYGYYKETLKLAEKMLPVMQGIWCMRYTYITYFYLCLSITAILREDPERGDREELLRQVAEYKASIELVASVNSINYATWLMLIEAELGELTEDYGGCLENYEGAIDHAVLHGFILDEALSLELYADFLVRRGAARPARGIVLDSVSAYRRVSAFGKADYVAEKYEFLLYGTRSLSTMDAATQTDLVDSGTTTEQMQQNAMHHAPQTPAERTSEWLDPPLPVASQLNHSKASGTGGLSAVGLDMLDLQSILESSQLLSSELDVDRLLEKLTEIIVESTGAEVCGIVVEEDDGWFVAATGSPEGVPRPPANMPLDKVQDQVARQITLYVLRFREQVFLRNVLEDERFANVPPEWMSQFPDGCSAIALPILHGDNVLLGSLFCQAPPNTFTERTVTLLKLLVNQIAISIANALLFKRIEKVSASNSSMLAVQKEALAQAREAEKKAKVAEAEAMENVRLKEEAARAKSMFLANVSHELRTPLNGVIGMSEMLKSTQLTKEQEEHADSIRVCADTLLSVINDILDFSKLEAGKMQVFSVPLSLVETINEVVRALSYTNIECGLQTLEKLDLDPNLIVMGDPVRLHQILMNLMSNAYKFTAKGNVTVRARIDFEDADSIKATISVSDTGIGISDEQQKKLFLPFSQADSSTARSYGGTGLGLSICKAIIENVMKGHIWLESTPGVGTTVSFTLPFKKVKASANGEANSAHPTGREADPMAIFTPPAIEGSPGARAIPSLSGIPRNELKVCIAEDNPINQKIAINFVKKLGFNCEAYADGQQAVDALSRASLDSKPFHLVLMDVQMPVLDGYNATREIRKHTDPAVRDVLVIAMTASAIRGDREKCLEAGMNNYLAKPVRAETLKQMVESYLNQPSAAILDLQEEANNLVHRVLSDEGADSVANSENGTPISGKSPVSFLPERPKSARNDDTKIRLLPEEMAHKSDNQIAKQALEGFRESLSTPGKVSQQLRNALPKATNSELVSGKEDKQHGRDGKVVSG
ncbi:hypothetical protein K431DRAFT_225201 [Polychaeton citri CBS 116435]|uniref:histidine kinase n=1 Tax=Polychaeton citri CBS 116435 TaxID=1314669 RepID=A0A9P4Q5J5_9PEZI|nr:hypothetical protein K431DRAFT_225201 [Polychaeton citri CBS 116435]